MTIDRPKDIKLPRCPARTTTGFSFSMVSRTLNEGIAERLFNRDEMLKVLDFFGMERPACVYCGASPAVRWDHVVPVAKGGDTVLGNMVPACARCDDSKQHYDLGDWALSDAQHAPRGRGVPDVEERIARVLEYISAFDYRSQSVEARLTPEERAELDKIRDDLVKQRKRIDEFLARHSKAAGALDV